MSAASDHAYEIIRLHIRSGALHPGDRLIETKLVGLCNVSRTPVREALRRLASDGLVRITPKSGASVAQWNTSELSDLYSVRATLEAQAAGLAATRRTDDDVRTLQDLAVQMRTLCGRKVGKIPADKVTASNNEFHETIISAARNRALEAALGQVSEAPLILRTFELYTMSDLQRSVEQHFELVRAISAQDSEWASAAMRAHIHAGLDVLKNFGGGP